MNRISRIVSFILLIAIALSLVVIRGVPASLEAVAVSDFDDGQLIVVSLGDSFSSGEGIEPFYGQNKNIEEKAKDNNWLAHRSESSWAGMIHIEGMPEGKTLNDYNVDAGKANADSSIQWYFRASSGAKTKHLKSTQTKKVKVIDVLAPLHTIEIPTEPLPEQLSVFDGLKGKVDYVTLTIGGNDVDFTDIITRCVCESSYLTGGWMLNNKLLKLWDDIDNTRKKIKQAYKDIEDAAGEQATIIVAGYPKLLDADGKGVPFSKQEASTVNYAVTKFNYVIHSVVEECQREGMRIVFADVEEEFDKKSSKGRHQAYSGDAWINPVMPLARGQDLDQSAICSAYSMHPNKNGAEAYKRCVENAIKLHSDSAGHYWHECSGYHIDYDKSELSGLVKVYINGKSTLNEEKCNDKVCHTPHAYGDWITDASTGEKYRKCTVCGYEQKETTQNTGTPVRTGLADKWYAAHGETLVINEDGTGSSNGRAFTYTISGDNFRAVSGGETVIDQVYKLDGEYLELWTDGSEDWSIYYRASSVEPPQNKLVGGWARVHDVYGCDFLAFTNNYTSSRYVSYKAEGNVFKAKNQQNDYIHYFDDDTLIVDGNILYVFEHYMNYENRECQECRIYYRTGTEKPDISPGKLVGTWNSPDGYSIVIGEEYREKYHGYGIYENYGYMIDKNKNFIDSQSDYNNEYSVEVCGDILNVWDDMYALMKSYRYTLEGNTLTLYNLDGSFAARFVRS